MAGRTIALLEARRSGELASLVSKQGGTPFSAPALREETVDDPAEIAAFLDALVARPPTVVILQTGVGVERLFAATDRLGRRETWERLLGGALIVARGPKPTAALRAAGFSPARLAASPYTTHEVLALFAPGELQDQIVAVQHYGERNVELVDTLKARGARVVEVEIYRWALPEDTGPVRRLIHMLPQGTIDAVAFTSQVQVRHLATIATEEGAPSLAGLLAANTLVASVGPVTTAELVSYGIRVDVEASPPKSGALIGAIAARLGPNMPPLLDSGASAGYT